MIEIASTTNPIFRNFPEPFSPSQSPDEFTRRMTFAGALRKTVILAICTSVCAVWLWKSLSEPHGLLLFPRSPYIALILLFVLVPLGLVGLSLWRKTLSRFTAPIYAMLQGVYFGFVAVVLEPRFHGVVMQIFCLTFTVCIALAFVYRFGLIRAADAFYKKLAYAVLGVVLYFAAAWLLPFIGVNVFPLILKGRGAALSGIIVIIAATTFISGYDIASKSAELNHPEYMEWHAAFGLIISMVWLYAEGLRIFFKDRVPNESPQA